MTDENNADVTVTSTVRAVEMTFLEVPETRVEFTADTDDRTSSSGTRRVRLPDPVQEGVTYVDVRVEHWITANLDIDTST